MLRRTPLKRKTPLRAKTYLQRGTSRLQKTPLKQMSSKRKGYENELNRMRAQVKERDNPQCILCGAPSQEIHHIVPRSAGGTNDIDNLCCVCWHCHHVVIHGSEGVSMRDKLQELVANRT